MKKKIFFSALTAAVISASAFTFALSNEGDDYIADIHNYTAVDSVFKGLGFEEKVLQLYIYDLRDVKLGASVSKPSGYFYNAHSFSALKNEVEIFGQNAEIPFFNICSVAKPMTDLPNYMNPFAVLASGKDEIVVKNFSVSLSDTLKSIGINTLNGFVGEKNEMFDFGEFSVRRIDVIDSLKKLLLSENEMIIGNINPDLIVSAAQKLSEKDKKGVLRDKIDEKVLKILRQKYHYNPDFESKIQFSRRDAALLAASKSITCVNNESEFLPLRDLSDVAVIQIGGLRQNGFLSRASNYCKPDYYYCNPTVLETKGVIKENANKNVIFLINCKLEDKEIVSVLRRVARSGHVAVVNIDFEDNLKVLDAKSAIQVFGSGWQPGDLAAQAVFGGMTVKGKFPLDGFDKIKKGSGKVLMPTRLQYLQDGEFNRNYRDTIDSIINFAILNRCFPGCQFFVCKDNKVLINKAFGCFTYDVDAKPVSTTDIYDIASLTKISAATVLAMYLTGEKKLDPKAKLGNYFSNTVDCPYGRKTVYDVSIESILEHRSGISPNVPVFRYTCCPYALRRGARELNLNMDSLAAEELKNIIFNEFYSDHYIKDSAEVRVCENLWLKNNYADTIYNSIMRLSVSDRKKYVYSDVNMILLQMAEQNILQCRPDSFLRKNFYAPLGMKNTCYTPYKYFGKRKIAPTEKNPWTGKYLCGDVHDPSAALLGGVSGNAGLFSSAEDLGILFQMLLNKGTYGGKRYLDSLTVEKFTSRQPNTGRALGFDMAPSKFAALNAPASTFGHTGFTGTCAWADPENKIVIVFLSNRVYPEASNNKINTLKIRQKVCQAVYDGLGI
jgi:CubicO group peptidase (beta-lactamase class C family)